MAQERARSVVGTRREYLVGIGYQRHAEERQLPLDVFLDRLRLVLHPLAKTFFELVDRLPDGASQFRKAVRAEKDERDDEDEKKFRPADIEHEAIISNSPGGVVCRLCSGVI